MRKPTNHQTYFTTFIKPQDLTEAFETRGESVFALIGKHGNLSDILDAPANIPGSGHSSLPTEHGRVLVPNDEALTVRVHCCAGCRGPQESGA